MSNARKISSIAAAMKTMPFDGCGAAEVREPMLAAGMGVILPNGVSHRTVPVFTSTAVSAPQGGGVQGTPFGESKNRPVHRVGRAAHAVVLAENPLTFASGAVGVVVGARDQAHHRRESFRVRDDDVVAGVYDIPPQCMPPMLPGTCSVPRCSAA